MPAYSFNERFVPMILDGSKTQTIRARRKYPAKVGDKIFLFTGMRTKHCMKLGEGVCIAAKSILIEETGVCIWDRRLDEQDILLPTPGAVLPDEIFEYGDIRFDSFAWRDGFRPSDSTEQIPGRAGDLMLRFWRNSHEPLPFIGDLIIWQNVAPDPGRVSRKFERLIGRTHSGIKLDTF